MNLTYEEELKNIVQHLKNGHVILYPSDTNWVIGCDSENENAIEKIKDIITDSSFTLLMTDARQIAKFIADPIPDLQSIIDAQAETINIIYPNAINLSNQLLNIDGSVNIRVTQDSFCRSLIKRIRKPIIEVMASLSNQELPISFDDIDLSIVTKVDYPVKYRQQEKNMGKAIQCLKIHANGSLSKFTN
jgi:L-threonylcarbamoyladenylate synthase